MVKESKYGPMDRSTRATGNKGWPTEKEDLSTLMETSMKEIGLMIELMVKVEIVFFSR